MNECLLHGCNERCRIGNDVTFEVQLCVVSFGEKEGEALSVVEEMDRHNHQKCYAMHYENPNIQDPV